MAKRIKNAGMKFLLDFHYTDNWADPEKQHMPESWKIHSGSGLEGHIYTYTKETVQRFIEEGVRPDMILEYQDYRKEVNEIVHGVSDGLGAGTFIWEATSPQWGGLFDNRGRTTDRMKIYDDFWNEIKSKSK